MKLVSALLVGLLVGSLAIVPLPVLDPAGLVEVGWASQYAPGTMERVVLYRQRLGQLPEDLSRYDGGVAVLECARIGQDVWLNFGEGWGRYLAADCASKSDARVSDGLSGWEWMVRGRAGLPILVEVDHETAKRHGFVGRLVMVQMWGGVRF